MRLDSLYFVRRHRGVALVLFHLSLGFAFVLVTYPGTTRLPVTNPRGPHGNSSRAANVSPSAARSTDKGWTRPSEVAFAAAEVRTRVTKAYAGLPLSFEANAGQVDGRVKFLSRGSGYTLFLTGDKAVLSLKKPGVRSQESGKNQTRSGVLPVVPSPLRRTKDERQRTTNHELRTKNSVLAMQLVGVNPNATVTGTDQLPGKSNYFIGDDPNKWHVNVPTYAQVKYGNVYPGVDLIYYGNQRQLEYDFVVAPGADPGAIRLELQTADSKLAGAQSKIENRKSKIDRPLRIAENGDLVVKIDGREVCFHKPVVYQDQSTVDSRQSKAQPATFDEPRTTSGDRRHAIEARFVLRGRQRVGFQLASYDHSRSLVIDPVLVYSTYLGGNADDKGEAIAVDSSGNAYITGSTLSPNFPTTPGAFQPACSKLPSPPSPPGTCSQDAFVTKIKADGSALIYSTYLGGSGTDSGFAIAVDGTGNAYMAGQTNSADFPTKNPFQATCGVAPNHCAFTSNAFVTKLDSTGSSLVYSTYLGGSGPDFALGIAVDSSGEANVTGGTASSDFPTQDPLPGHSTLEGTSDAFVTKFNSAGTGLVYSTYLGGSGGDQGDAIGVDSSGNAYLTGGTSSNNFPTTASAFQTSYGGNTDAFVTKLSFAASKLTLAYSTYLGGSNFDQGLAIALDSSENAYVGGVTNSGNFPVAGAAGTFQSTPGGGNDGFVAKLDSAGKTLVYSTYLGGSGDDSANGIAVDGSGRAYVTGSTLSPNFPLENPVQSKNAGNGDAFVSKLAASGCGLTFSTYLGGHDRDAGVGMALDSLGDAYVVGQTASNDFPTANALQPNTGGGYDAFVTKATPAAAAATCLSPVALTFSSQTVGTTSAAQTVTLTNGGDVKLNISGFTANPSQEFAQTNTCAGSVDVGKNCTVSVTFTPAASGTRTGTITISDDDSSSGNPHTIALTGTGADFGITTAPTKATVTAGQTTSAVTVTLTPVGGFNAMVSLSCTGLPTAATCSFTPSSVTVNGSSVTSSLTISTTARSTSMVPPAGPAPHGPPPAGPSFLAGLGAWLAGLLVLVVLAVWLAARRRPRRAWALSLPLGAMLLFILVWSSCVSGSPGTPSGTPAGTYNVMVTGTSGSSGSLVHAASFTLTVQ